MTERAYQRMLKMKFVRFVAKRFGIVYLDQHPARSLSDDGDDNAAKANELALTRSDFLSVYFPPFQPKFVHRKEALLIFDSTSSTYIATLHIPTTIDMRASVNFHVITLQCFFRQRAAVKRRAFMLRISNAIAIFQRKFRKRYERYHLACIRITCLFRQIFSRKHVLKKSKRVFQKSMNK
jgi:hypothetical protein